MSVTAYNSKLAELRVRTDRDLVKVIRKELERALTLASVASTRQSPLYLKAERIHKQSAALVPRIGTLSDGERVMLETKLRQLGAGLDAVPRAAGACGQAAFAS
ncbi:MAG TPA: hypothetical protein VFA33_24230 [Bryobacteraceae bacterium]|nr:hypothetical protein [Bryobacteraceae bacterium]